MASAGYDLSTVSLVQSLIDEHKDEMSEMEYLKACNLLAQVYKNETSSDSESELGELLYEGAAVITDDPNTWPVYGPPSFEYDDSEATETDDEYDEDTDNEDGDLDNDWRGYPVVLV